MCITPADQRDKDKIKIDLNGQYWMFVGADGPCEISVNVGGKIFRAHYDEINRGLIVSGSSVQKAGKKRGRKLPFFNISF